MAYYRKSYRRKGMYNRRGRRVKNIFYKRAAKKGYYMAKKALSMLNVEYKSVDLASFGETGVISSTGSCTFLDPIAQGDGNSSRDGKSVRIKSVFARLHLTMHASATTTRIRMILFIKKDVNLTAPAPVDVITGPTVNGLRNLNNTHNIKVLMDRSYTLDSNLSREKQIKIYKKLNHKMKWEQNNTGSDVTDLEKNGLFLLLISDEGTNTPSVGGGCRVRFIDN